MPLIPKSDKGRVTAHARLNGVENTSLPDVVVPGGAVAPAGRMNGMLRLQSELTRHNNGLMRLSRLVDALLNEGAQAGLSNSAHAKTLETVQAAIQQATQAVGTAVGEAGTASQQYRKEIKNRGRNNPPL